MTLQEQFQIHLKNEWYYPAIKTISELHYLHEEFNSEIDPIKVFTPDKINLILEKIESDEERIIRILSFGKRWDEDEVLLLFTIYIQLKLVTKYLIDFKLEFPQVNFKRIDAHMEALNSKFNQSSVKSAKILINKNWPTIKLEDFNLGRF